MKVSGAVNNYAIFVSGSDAGSEQYRSLCGFSMPADRVEPTGALLRRLMEAERIGRIQWSDLVEKKYRLIAEKCIDQVLEKIVECDLRVDIAVWDSLIEAESDPDPEACDPIAHMVLCLMEEAARWRQSPGVWSVYCDARLDIEWSRVRAALADSGSCRRVETIASAESPCCQVADLFAGVAAFSRNRAKKFIAWAGPTEERRVHFEQQREGVLSALDRENFKFLGHLNRECRSRSLGVSLMSCGYLWTPNPENPVNFRHYGPRPRLA